MAISVAGDEGLKMKFSAKQQCKHAIDLLTMRSLNSSQSSSYSLATLHVKTLNCLIDCWRLVHLHFSWRNKCPEHQ